MACLAKWLMTLVTTMSVLLAFGVLPQRVTAQTSQGASGVERVERFERLTGPRIDVPEGPEGVAPLRAFCPERTDTCRNYWAYTIHFVQNYTIPLRDKELLILRTAWLSRGDYVWGRHNVMAQGAGLTEEEIARITRGPDAPGWSAFDAVLLRAADELHRSRFISEPTWSALGRRYTQEQLVEVVLIVGNYTQLTMFQNTLGVQLPVDVDGLPDEADAR